jgi:hypothetical protein
MVDEVGPLAGLQQVGGLSAECLVVAEERPEADVDVIGVVAQGERVGAKIEQRGDLVRAPRALQSHQHPDGLLRDAAALVSEYGTPSTLAMSTALRE